MSDTILSRLVRTMSSYFRVGDVRLNTSSGELQIKSADGSSDADIKASKATFTSDLLVSGSTALSEMSAPASVADKVLLYAVDVGGTTTLKFKYPGSVELIVPTTTDTLVGKNTSDVLTNKTLTSPVINTSISGSAIDTDETLAGNSDSILASQKAIKGYADNYGPVRRWVKMASNSPLPSSNYTGTGGGTITATSNGVLTVDGISVYLNDRVLVFGEINPQRNGVYLCTTEGTVSSAFVLTRATDSNTDAKIGKAIITVTAGNDLGGELFLCTNDSSFLLGTTWINYVQLTGANSIYAYSPLIVSNNTLSIEVDDTALFMATWS